MLWLILAALAANPPTATSGPGLRIHPQNPYSFTYNGRPWYLIGSGMESFCKSWSDSFEEWRAYLDMLYRRGINRVRFFPWSFCWKGDPVRFSPWRTVSVQPRRYDLFRWNDNYWRMLRRVVSYAQRRDIVIEYILFDYCSLPAEEWAKSPWSEMAGGACPGKTGKPSFFQFAEWDNLMLFRQRYNPRWPWQKRNQWLQQTWVIKNLRELGEFNNIYWELNNELGWGQFREGEFKWAKHMLAFLRRHDPKRRLVAMSCHPEYFRRLDLDICCPHPIPYFNRKLRLPDSVPEIIAKYRPLGRPVVCDETGYYPPPPRDVWQKERLLAALEPKQIANERKSYWWAFVSGGYWTAVCWRPFDDNIRRKWAGYFARFVRLIPYLWRRQPHPEWASSRLCASDGSWWWVAISPDGSEITVDTSSAPHPAFAGVGRWYDPTTGQWTDRFAVRRSKAARFRPPDRSHEWILYVVRPEI